MTKFLDSMFTRDKHYRLDKTFDKNRFQINLMDIPRTDTVRAGKFLNITYGTA